MLAPFFPAIIMSTAHSSIPPASPSGLLRIGIVGAGDNTRRRHIPGLRAIPGVDIIGVCNSSPESSARAAKELGIARAFPDWASLVRASEIDAVVVGTWPDLHAAVSVAALGAGKHVLCEARMARNAAEARAMLEASRARPKLVAQLVPAPFTLEVDATVRRLILEGYLGRLLAVEVRGRSAAGGGFLDRDAPAHWRQDKSISGHNVLSLGIWYECVRRWVGDVVKLVALGGNFVPERRDAATGRMRATLVPDYLTVAGAFACGARFSFTVSAVSGHGPEDGVWLFGDEGTLRFGPGGLSGGRRGEPGLAPVSAPAHERGGWRVEAEFVGAIRGEESVRLTTFEDGLAYMRFTDAVARSLAEGRSVAPADM